MMHPPMAHDWSREEVLQIEAALERIQGEKLEALVSGMKKLRRQERAMERARGGKVVHSLRERTKALLALPKSFYTKRRDLKTLRAAVARLRAQGHHREADYALKTWG